MKMKRKKKPFVFCIHSRLCERQIVTFPISDLNVFWTQGKKKVCKLFKHSTICVWFDFFFCSTAELRKTRKMSLHNKFNSIRMWILISLPLSLSLFSILFLVWKIQCLKLVCMFISFELVDVFAVVVVVVVVFLFRWCILFHFQLTLKRRKLHSTCNLVMNGNDEWISILTFII